MYGDNSAEFTQILQGKAFAEFVMAKVRQALDEILIATCTLEFDAFGQSLLSELEYACQRGVRVRCLIDASGSPNFIHDHPALFTKLETQIRIQHARNMQDNVIVFDRRLAVVGSHALCERSIAVEPENTQTSRCITGSEAAEFAARLEAAWERARSYT